MRDCTYENKIGLSLASLGEKTVGAIGLYAQFSSLMFALCYADEPIRYIIMQYHMYSAKWIKPVSDAGLATIEEFRQHHRKYIKESENNGESRQ